MAVDPPSLKQRQLRSLKSRFHLDGPYDTDSEPKPWAAAWWVLPLWVKIVTYTVGIPSFLCLLFLIFATHVDPFDTLLGKVSLGGWIAVCVLQSIFMLRANWRMEI